MEWTIEPPEVPGWYWITGHYTLRACEHRGPYAVLVEPHMLEKDKLVVWVPFMDYSDDLPEFMSGGEPVVKWLGPVTPPPV